MFHFIPQAHCVHADFFPLNVHCTYLLLVMSVPAPKSEPQIHCHLSWFQLRWVLLIFCCPPVAGFLSNCPQVKQNPAIVSCYCIWGNWLYFFLLRVVSNVAGAWGPFAFRVIVHSLCFALNCSFISYFDGISFLLLSLRYSKMLSFTLLLPLSTVFLTVHPYASALWWLMNFLTSGWWWHPQNLTRDESSFLFT